MTSSDKGKGKLPDRSRIRKTATTDGSSKPTPRTGVKSASKQKVTESKKAAKANADKLAKQKVIAASRGVAPSLGDGTCVIKFIEVGTGDCTMIATPEGKVIMIDCGSLGEDDDRRDTATWSRTRGAVNDPFLKNGRKLDVLILTHPDADHHNKLEIVLGTSRTIRCVYHSAQWEAWNESCKNLITGHIYAVSHNRDPAGNWVNKRIGWDHTGSSTQPPEGLRPAIVRRMDGRWEPADLLASPIDNWGVRILNEANCTVTILASNVGKYQDLCDNSDEKNRGSIVTLVEAHGERLLLTGDATMSTERYLANTNPTVVTDVDVVQVPHHGSVLTSSSPEFVTLVNAQKRVNVSAGKKIEKHHFPRSDTIDRYVTSFEALGRTATPHEVGRWTTPKWDYINDNIAVPLYTTGSTHTWHYVVRPAGSGSAS